MDLVSALKKSRRVRSGSGTVVFENNQAFNEAGEVMAITSTMLTREDWEPLSPNKKTVTRVFEHCKLEYSTQQRHKGTESVYVCDGGRTTNISCSLPSGTPIKITAEWEEWA